MSKIAVAKTSGGKFAIVYPMSINVEDAVKKLPTTAAYFIIDKSQLNMEAPHPHIDTTQFDWSNPDGYGERVLPTEPAS